MNVAPSAGGKLESIVKPSEKESSSSAFHTAPKISGNTLPLTSEPHNDGPSVLLIF